MAAELSSDEFLRLQEELLNLKMQTEELRQENAQLRRHIHSEPQGTMANMDALRKAGAGAVSGAVSALGQRAASLKSSLDGSTFHLHPQAPQGESHNHSQREAAELAEVAALQERLKAVMEDLSAARQDAMLAQREATAAADPRADRGGVASPPVEEVLTLSQALLLKVQQQQRDLERVREAVDRQQAQIARLTEKVATEKAGKPSAAALPALEEQLRSAEGKLDHLGQRLQSSQGTSRLTYELRCNMESVLDRVRQRDQAIEQLLTRQERMEHASVLRRERLSYAQEDLASCWMRHVDPQPGSESSDIEGKAEPEEPDPVQNLCTEEAVGVQVLHEDTAELGWEAAVAASPTSSCQSDAGELHVLEQELQALQSAMKELQLQNADRAEGLRAQIREHQRKLDEPEPEKQIEEESRNGQTNQEESFDSILYVQKIEELERQNAGLEQDLELLKSSELTS
ncbi:unnamed protein product [Durusdinium trenchii]|uniref:Uncharacterized protein n=1 Tax=Durusdinium trenchii TaxID=1381693 RepID=A0ABP0INW5_9DINO